ncbi:YraN family protein [Candidatus Omnitrophota bacterium]
MSLARIDTGKRGEDLAVSYLKKQGYKIIEKNYKTKQGEIDIIGRHRGCVCFVEVRARNTRRFGLPEDSINRKKQTQIAKVALSYIKRFGLEEENCRFDVVSVENVNSISPKLKLLRNAFELVDQYKY